MNFESLLAVTTEEQGTNRVLQLEERARNRKGIPGDWEGIKVGTYKKRNDDGTITVTVEGKDYIAKKRAHTSIPKGTIVNVTASGGRYYASW